MKKVWAICLSSVMAGSMLLASCGSMGSGNTQQKVDSSKTQLYVGNFDGGYGHEWIYEAARRFETKFADTSFEDGKTGVQVLITNKKEEFGNTYTFYETINTLPYDMFFAPVPRLGIQLENKILDLEDVYTAKLTEFGEDESIADKMLPFRKESEDRRARQQWLPYAEAYFGCMVYDVDLFEEKEFFIAKDGIGSDGKITAWTGTGEKWIGRDGIAGTFDDGLPQTEDQLFQLMTRMVKKDVTPFTFAGQYMAYANAYVENAMMNYDDGATANALDRLEGSIVDTKGKTITITPSNGYETTRAAANLAALKFAKRLLSDPAYYSSDAFGTTQTHIMAQNEFLVSAETETRIAMLIEGSWWENEALDTFNKLAKIDSDYAYKTRRFGVMPAVQPTGSYGTKTSTTTSISATFVNKTTTKPELAKLFLKYLYTDEILALFHSTTGVPACLDYSLTTEQINNLSYYQKQLLEIHENKNGTINKVMGDRETALYKADQSHYPYNFTSSVKDPSNETAISDPLMNFYTYKDITPESYFKGMYDFSKNMWDKYLSKKL